MERKTIQAKQIHVGNRSYFFDVKETSQCKRYLKITESKRVGTNDFERHQIMVFEEDIDTFSQALMQILVNFHR